MNRRNVLQAIGAICAASLTAVLPVRVAASGDEPKLSDVSPGPGDFVFFNPHGGGQGTTLGCVLRPLSAAEAAHFTGGVPAWVVAGRTASGTETNNFFATAADILSFAKSNKTIADDLGPLVVPPVPEPIT